MPDEIRIEDVPPEVREEILKVELRAYRARKIAERQEKADLRAKRKRQPSRNRYKAVREGRYKRWRRPVAKVEDRRWVPGALLHWRTVNGLSPRLAQGRIGYSPKSHTWNDWEAGHTAPSYEALLRIIAATGLGYYKDPAGGTPPETVLEQREVAARERRNAKRKTRKKRRAGVGLD